MRPLYSQQSLIKSDRPFSDLYLSSNKKMVFFIGKNYLWQWQPLQQRIFRLKIGIGPHHRQLVNFAGTLWTYTNNSLLTINEKTLKPTVFDLSQIAPLRYIAATETTMVVGGSHAIAIAEKQAKEFKVLKAEDFNFSAIKLSPSRLWWYHKGLYLTGFKFKTQKKLMDCSKKENLKIWSDKAWYQCGSRLFVFSASGSLIQIIPEKSQAEIVDFSITKTAHEYLFSNGVLEIYRPETQSVKALRFKLPSSQISKFFTAPHFLVGLDQDGPFLISL